MVLVVVVVVVGVYVLLLLLLWRMAPVEASFFLLLMAAARRDALPLPLLPCSTAHSTVLHAVWVACAAMQYAVCSMQYAMRCNDEGRWDERQKGERGRGDAITSRG